MASNMKRNFSEDIKKCIISTQKGAQQSYPLRIQKLKPQWDTTLHLLQ